MATARATALVEIRDQLQARAGEFAAALPSHIKPEYFQRATLTALSQNPKLVDVDRRSLWNALMRCAQDGLICDGREAALVIFRDRERGEVAQYMPMVAGIRKLVLQSGEITRFEQTVAYSGDAFEYRLGDHPQIDHKPVLGAERGDPVAVYSVAQFRDGTLSREVMHVAEIEKTRSMSRSKDGGPWRDWWSEMARKTVAKRHAKMLPMSHDAVAALARDDKEQLLMPLASLTATPAAPEQRPRLVEQFDALSVATDSDTAKPKRGRPRKADDTPNPDIDELAEINKDELDALPANEQIDIEQRDNQQKTMALDDGWPGGGEPSADYYLGAKDARAGHASCLNRDIRENPQRLREWTLGYKAAKAT